MKTACGMALVLVLAAFSLAWAEVESGPKAGDKLPALKVFGVVGIVEGKEADFAAERKDAPTVVVFVAADENGVPVGKRPVGRFLKTLDGEVTKASDQAIVVAVWLGDQAFEKQKEFLPRIHTSLQFAHTSLTAFDGAKSGPDGWGVNPDAHLTVVVIHQGKVVKSFAFESVNETDVRPVLAELKKAVAEK